MIVDDLARRGLPRLVLAIAASALVGQEWESVACAQPRPMKCADGSIDTAKESGGFLYIYDGATLAANPAARTVVTIDLAGEITPFAKRPQEAGPASAYAVFNKNQDHAILSFLSGHVLFMDAKTRNRRPACRWKNVHAPGRRLSEDGDCGEYREKKFIRIWTDYAAHTFNFDPEKDV